MTSIVAGAATGSASGWTWICRSPRTRSGCLLVTSTCSHGQRRSRSSTSGAAATICSKLSSTRSRCFSSRYARSCSSGGLGPAHLQAEGLRNGRGHLIRVADRSQAHEERTVVELLQHVRSHCERKPRLADAGRADQRDQPRAVAQQPSSHHGDVMRAADEGCELGGQVVGALRTEEARAGGEVLDGAACQRNQVGQVGIVCAERLRQRRDQRRGGLQVAGLDFAQRDLGAAGLLRQRFLCQPQRLAPLLEPLAEGCVLSMPGLRCCLFFVAQHFFQNRDRLLCCLFECDAPGRRSTRTS